MKSRRIVIAILFSVLLGLFPAYKLIKAKAKSNTTQKVSLTKEKKEKEIAKLKEKTKGLPLIASVIKIAEKITKKIETEIKFSEIANLLGIKGGPVKTYLDKFVIKTPVVEAVADGMSIKGTIVVNNNPLEAFLEIGRVGSKRRKEATDKGKTGVKKKPAPKTDTTEIKKTSGGWYVIFYIKSPKKWKISDYFPDIFDLKKIFPKLNLNKISPKGKPLKPDLFELEDSYFYIATADIPNHETIDNVYQGVGFKGKLRFIGIFKILDQIFGLKGKPVEVTGKIKVPKFEGSTFKIYVPTEAVIIPEYLKLGKKRIKFIPGFKVTLAPHQFSITFVLGIPIIKATGGIKVDFPFIKETLEFYSGIDFSGTRLKLYGGQRTNVTDLFGVKGLSAKGFKAGLIWDFVVSAQLAAELGVVTAGVGALVGLLPMGVIFEGGMGSGKSKLEVDVDASVHGTKGIDFSFKSKGSLFTKDFAKFWLDLIAKNPKATKDFMKIIPPFVLEDVVVDAAWAEEKDKKFEVSVGKVELIPGVPASMKLNISEKGIEGKGSIAPVFFPSKKNALLELTRKDDKTKGPYFDLDVTVSPMNISLKGDGRIYANLGPLGKLDSGTKFDISDDGIELDSVTKILDFDADLKIVGSLKGKLEDWKAKGSFTQKSTEKISKLLKASSKKLLEAAKNISDRRNKLIEDNNNERKKAIADIQKAKDKAIKDIKAHFNKLGDQTQFNINKLNKEIRDWTVACRRKNVLEQPWCNLFQVSTRQIAVATLKVHKDVTLKAVSGIAQLGTQAALTTGQIFTRIILDTKKNFEVTGTGIAQMFTTTAGIIAKMINDIITKVFTVHNLKFDANIADLKKLKAPYIELDATIFGKPFKKPFKGQLDFKKPDEFIKKIANFVAKDWLVIANAEVDKVIDEANKKINSAKEYAKKKMKEANIKVSEETKKVEAQALKIAK